MPSHFGLPRRLAFAAASLLLAVSPVRGAPPAAAAADSSGAAEQLTARLLAPVAAANHARDSLARLAEQVTGTARDLLEEQIWQLHLEAQARLVRAATELGKRRGDAADTATVRRMLDEAVRRGWPRYLAQLERRNQMLQSMMAQRDAASGGERLARESELTTMFERTVRMHHDLVDGLLALDRLGVDVSAQRRWEVDRLQTAASHTKAHLTVLGRERGLATARVQRAPDDAAARSELEAVEQGTARAESALEAEISMLSRLGQDVTPLRVSLILATGKLSLSALDLKVVAGLAVHAKDQLLETLARRLPRWVFQVLLLVGIFAGFRLLAKVTRRATSNLVQKAELSQLMRDTIANWSSKLVMMIGLVILLRQLGFQIGPMLAGFGIAGVVVGFALQDTLSNFAAGAMILAYQPFDVGDTIVAAGVEGTVSKMSLVSTTVLTLDNQTLIIPNKKVWGDVIRNITAQGTRRVDLMFGVAYGADVEHVERVLLGIVAGDNRVLKTPAPLVKLHQLAESSVNFVVRVWTVQENYWNVYWDTTRAVKLAFDREGIEIPYPQRDVHLRTDGAPSTGGSAPDVVTRSAGPPSA